MTDSLFEKLGGSTAVDAAVDIFYRKVLADDRMSQFFDVVDMEAQHAKQKSFLTYVFGGPNKYSGRELRAAHTTMNLTEEHFSAIVEHLEATLRDLNIPESLISEVRVIVGSTKKDVLNQ